MINNVPTEERKNDTTNALNSSNDQATNLTISVGQLDNTEESKEDQMDRSTSVNNESASTSSPKGMLDKFRNLFVRKWDLRESRQIMPMPINNQNRFIDRGSESGTHLTSENNTDTRDEIARASQNIELLKSRSEQPNS